MKDNEVQPATTGIRPFSDESCPGELYRDTSGDLWQVIGWITRPAAILVNRRTGEKHVEVIGCRNAERFSAEGRISLEDAPPTGRTPQREWSDIKREHGL